MRPTRRAVLGAVATASIAGCTGGDGGDDGATPTQTDTPTDTPTERPTASPTATEQAATVQVRAHDELGEVLVDPDGMTLYMFERDTRGEATSACTGDCVDAWPPLTVDDTPTRGEGVTAELEAFEREDGDTQVMAGGWPLYYFTNDQASGDANGQGVGDVWWVLTPDGMPVRSNATPTPTEAGGSGSGGY